MGYSSRAGLPGVEPKDTGVADSTRPTILSVDDEQAILDSIRLELEDDFDVVTATSGAEALDLLAHRHVDVVLLDLRMPDMDGAEVLRRLGSARAQRPIISPTSAMPRLAPVRTLVLERLHVITMVS